MKRDRTFAFRLTDEDKARLEGLAEHLDRSEADVLRVLVEQASRRMKTVGTK